LLRYLIDDLTRRAQMQGFISRRRRLIVAAGSASTAVAAAALGGCEWRGGGLEDEVTANEDLMREHGIIRRALFVYAEAGRRARREPASIPLAALRDTARLFREFAEDYHERGLEEAHIFPMVRTLPGPAARLPDVLLAQHRRGREITDYVLKVASSSAIAPDEAERLASTLEALVAMYGPHAAYEDTEVFPAWKAALGQKGYDEMGEKFEQLERQMLGHDGFEDALQRIATVEAAFGLGDLSALTAPPPPTLAPSNLTSSTGSASTRPASMS
jgi:hemerythrin-like domain-containing protein